MQIAPILAALRWHKAGAMLITLQIALTLAIVCNALFIVHQRTALLLRPSGVDEDRLLIIQNQWMGKPPAQGIPSLMADDLNALRHLPGVAGVFATNAYPLGTNGWSMGVRYTMEQKTPTSPTAVYFADENGLSALGLKLVAGRNFQREEVGDLPARGTLTPSVIIITQALADTLFPAQSALGKRLCIGSAAPSTVVGVVERMQAFSGSFSRSWIERSTLVPYRLLADRVIYMIQVQPGRLDQVERAAPEALFAANPLRVIDGKDGVQTFADVRAAAYRSDSGVAILMGVICVLLLVVTSAGIVGLTSFWVGQRRRHIGIRRALGARKTDILNYFLTENLLISVGGVVVGTLLAIGMNLWMVSQWELARLSLRYVLIGVVTLLLLGQVSALVPALRASRVPPLEATRSV